MSEQNITDKIKEYVQSRMDGIKWEYDQLKDLASGKQTFEEYLQNYSNAYKSFLMQSETIRHLAESSKEAKEAIKKEYEMAKQNFWKNMEKSYPNIRNDYHRYLKDNEMKHKYDMSAAASVNINGHQGYVGVREKPSFWKRVQNVLYGKKSLYEAVRDNSRVVRKADALVKAAIDTGKGGSREALRKQITALRTSNGAKKIQEKQVQTNSDAYNAIETYARISAMEQMSGISGFSFNGKNKDECLDTLKQMPKDVINYALGQFRANTQKNPAGNADFGTKVSASAEKLSEQLRKDEQYGLAMNSTISPAAQSLQDVFNNVRQYKDADVYDSSESGKAIYEHKNKDFISDMQKIVDIYKANPNDDAVCGLLKDNLSLLPQAAVSAASHKEVDKMSELMFQLGKELQTNSSISSENKAKVYEGLANMTNYEAKDGRHYNAFTNSSMYKNSLCELMEKADSKDKDMFYAKLSDKKLLEYYINYEKAPERIQPQKQISVSLMKGLKREVYN